MALTAATWGGVDILTTPKISLTSVTSTNDWNNDVLLLQIDSTYFLQPQDDATTGVGNIKTLSLTFSNYVPPTSTEPLGACNDASLVAT